MSYYKKYRRIKEQLNEILDEELSENNSSSNDSDTVRPLVVDNPLSSHSNNEDLDEVFDLDGTIENDSLESESDVEEHCDLTEKLAKWAVENNCTRSSINQLLKILRESGHILPKDSRTLLQTPQVIITEDRCNGTYKYFGMKKQLIHFHKESLSDLSHINLIVNVDGVPLFKSSPQQFWPILVSVENLVDVFIVAIFYGNSKPNPLDDFLADFINEVKVLKNDGLVVTSNKTITVSIKCFVCDAPARAFLKCVVNHTGYSSCERCEIKGEWNGRVTFNSNSEQNLRIDEKFNNFGYPLHQKALTPLVEIVDSCVSQFSLDYMHLVCLGVMRRTLHYLMKGARICRLSQQQIQLISDNLVNLNGKLPSEFSRQPRSLHLIVRWKATEFREFILYTGPLVLKDILHEEYYSHFLTLHCAMRILLSPDDTRNEYIDFAKNLLSYFVAKAKRIYGDSFTVYNIHNLLHLAEDCQNLHSSLNEISAFKFENYLQVIKKSIRNANNPVAQIAKRKLEVETHCTQLHKKQNEIKCSVHFRDSCFRHNNKLVFVKRKLDDTRYECEVVHFCKVQHFYEKPMKSRDLSIGLIPARHCSLSSKKILSVEELHRKLVVLPYKDCYIVLPMIHCYV